MWLFAGLCAAADRGGCRLMPLPFSSPSPLPPSSATSTPFLMLGLLSVYQGRGGTGGGVVVINGRKPDDGMGRREIDRLHNLHTDPDRAVGSLSLLSHTRSNTVQTAHTHKHKSDHKHADMPTNTHTHTHAVV